MPTFLQSELSQTAGTLEMPESTTNDTVTLTLPGKIGSLRNKTKKPQCKPPSYIFQIPIPY